MNLRWRQLLALSYSAVRLKASPIIIEDGSKWEGRRPGDSSSYHLQPEAASKGYTIRERTGPVLPQVFVSHGISDDPVADRLAKKLRQELKRRAIPVIDEDQLPYARDFLGHFEAEAARSKVFVAIVTDLYPYKHFPMRELHLATQAARDGAQLVPVLLDFRDQDIQQRKRQWCQHWQQWEAAKPDIVQVEQYAADMDNLLSYSGPKVQAHELDEPSLIYTLANKIQQLLPPEPFSWSYDVFISHAGPQKPFARQIQGNLQRMGIRAFVDQYDLRPAEYADTEMMMVVRTAPVGVAILSAAFLDVKRSPWPLCELRMMAESNNKLLPVVYKDIRHSDLRDSLTAGLTEAYSLGQQADLRQSMVASGLQFSTPGQRNDLIRRVTRTTAVRCSTSADLESLDADSDGVCWAVLRSLADHAIRMQHAVTGSSIQRYLHIVRTIEVAMTKVTLGRVLPNLPDDALMEAHTYVLDLRQALEAAAKGVSSS